MTAIFSCPRVELLLVPEGVPSQKKLTRVYSGLCALVAAFTVLLTPIGVSAVDNATNTLATSTPSDSTSAQSSEPETPWYTSDWISGELETGDFVIGPGRVEVSVKPGESVVRYLTVTNRISANRSFELVVEDIAPGVGGNVIELLGKAKGPYTLRDYISFPQNTLTLGLGERAKIPVTITMPIDADPGGHYGSVLVTTVKDDTNNNPVDEPGMRSPIIARVGVLFFVTVPGAIERAGALANVLLIGSPWWFEKGPVTLGVAFENTGSVHLNPYGELRVTNMFGEEVGFKELEPWFVLPQSLRTRDVTFDREFLLGRYVAEVSINRGYDDIVDTKRVVFWVLPWKVLAGVFGALFAIIFFIRFFFRTFEFKRKGS